MPAHEGAVSLAYYGSDFVSERFARRIAANWWKRAWLMRTTGRRLHRQLLVSDGAACCFPCTACARRPLAEIRCKLPKTGGIEIFLLEHSAYRITCNLRSFSVSFLRCVWFMCSFKLQQKMRVGKDLPASFSILFSQRGSCLA